MQDNLTGNREESLKDLTGLHEYLLDPGRYMAETTTDQVQVKTCQV
jgi:hypothetical protein